MQTRTKIITATSLTGLFIASLFPAPSFAATELTTPPPVVAPTGPALEIERASFTAAITPAALPVFELDGLSMLETPPLILAGQTETEAPAEEASNTDGGELDDEVEPAGEDEFSVEPLAAGSTALGAKLVRTAKKYLGVPYVWGGTSPRGLDCSGLVKLVAKKGANIDLPRLARQQAKVVTKVKSFKSAKPGDLVGMRNGKHIAIYVGANRIIHAPQPGAKVSIRKLTKNDDIDTIRRLK